MTQKITSSGKKSKEKSKKKPQDTEGDLNIDGLVDDSEEAVKRSKQLIKEYKQKAGE